MVAIFSQGRSSGGAARRRVSSLKLHNRLWRHATRGVCRHTCTPGTFHPPTDHPGKDQFWTMGRTRTKSKKQRRISTNLSTTQSSSTSSTTTPSVPALISKAQSIIEQCDYDLASQFIQRILQRSPKNVEAREMLGVVQLETGLVQEARRVGSSPFLPLPL